jgi:hypothetical protein
MIVKQLINMLLEVDPDTPVYTIGEESADTVDAAGIYFHGNGIMLFSEESEYVEDAD